MKVQFKSQALVASMAVFSLISAACSSPGGDTTPTTGKVSLTLTRNGKVVVGMQAILQKESDGTEIGSALSDASGKVATTEFTGTARATFVDSDGTSNYLFTMREVKAGATINVELPLLKKANLGSILYSTPVAYPGADEYRVMLLTGTDASTDSISLPITPGDPRKMDVPEDAAQANGKVTLVAVAYQNLGLGKLKPIAYSVLKDQDYAPTPTLPSIIAFDPWKSDITNVSLRIGAIPAGMNPDQGSATIRQFTKGNYFSNYPFAQPATFSTAPLDFDMAVVPGVSDEFEMFATLQDTASKSIYALIRKTATLPTLSSWTPASSGLPHCTGMALDPLSPAGAPKFKWTQVGSAIGIADVALFATSWKSGGKAFGWYSIGPAESMDAGSYQLPALPAAYAAYVPPSGTIFDTSVMIYGDYSTIDDYDTFLKNENLTLLLFKLRPNQNIELNLSGMSGKP